LVAVGRIDDRQPAHAERGNAVGVEAMIVRPTVTLTPHHACHRVFADGAIKARGNNSGYAAHVI
jgi:hypothetical protein